MARSAAEVAELVNGVSKDAFTEWARLSLLQKRIDGKLIRTWMPSNADTEYKDLFRKASSPWLLFVRDCIAQGLIVDGYSDDIVWEEVWQANGMDGRQGDINREVVGLGRSYLLLLPAKDGGVAIRPLSGLTTYAVYSDPWEEFPDFTITRIGKQKASFWDSEWVVVDADAMYRFKGDPRRSPTGMVTTEHGRSYTPVVQLSNTLSVDGTPRSSIAPLVPIYQRVVDATFTLQMVQRYGAFPMKWMAGGEIAKNADGTPAVRASVDTLLHASGTSGETARFGSFDATNLEQVVAALEKHLSDLFTTAQVPPQYTGKVVNMSAEGIAAAEAGYFRNVAERQTSLGEGYELAMRVGADYLGQTEAAEDTSSQVEWADVSSRSLAQISDAIVKLATVGAPIEMLFGLLPGWSKQDVLEAAQIVRDRKAIEPPAA